METGLMTDATDPVLTELDDATGVARITFNRPGVFNALDEATAAAFEAATARLLTQPGLRCVVLTGAGKAFMAGGDVSAFAADLPAADRTLAKLLNHMHPALLNLRRFDAPIVAAVNGVAAGAGLSLVLAADYVIARASARFVLAYDKLGVPPDCGGSWFLARKVGRAKAFELMLLGVMLNAEEAVAAGIANEVVPDEAFEAQTRAQVERIAAGPTCAFGMFKRLLDTELPLAAHMELEREMFMAATRTEDFRTAARAFVTKQAAAFKGR
jgi:2-(1,2-epoxy-1,2-dihydrophenyl)acetyl-CoA isomerase